MAIAFEVGSALISRDHGIFAAQDFQPMRYSLSTGVASPCGLGWIYRWAKEGGRSRSLCFWGHRLS
jgi:hypothetical protein